jgi:hypothetical protein
MSHFCPRRRHVAPLIVTVLCIHALSGQGKAQIQGFVSNANGWLSAVRSPHFVVFETFFPSSPTVGCLSGPSAYMNLGALNVSITLLNGQCAVYDGTSLEGASDASLPNTSAVSVWEFSEPINAFYTYYGSFGDGTTFVTVTMNLYSGGKKIGQVWRRNGPSHVDAYGHGFRGSVNSCVNCSGASSHFVSSRDLRFLP